MVLLRTATRIAQKIQTDGVAGALRAARNKCLGRVDDRHSYLQHVTGVVHVGANLGQERYLYAARQLKVLWVEPLPNIFVQLYENIRSLPNQIAVNHLVTDKDDAEYMFHIADNEGQSSSILELARHREIWPDVHYTSNIKLTSITLDSLMTRIGGTASYQALVMDTQGSELLVLKGAVGMLRHFRFIETEAADFESYSHCARAEELVEYLEEFGFVLIRADKFAESPRGGTYFDLLFERIQGASSRRRRITLEQRHFKAGANRRTARWSIRRD